MRLWGSSSRPLADDARAWSSWVVAREQCAHLFEILSQPWAQSQAVVEAIALDRARKIAAHAVDGALITGWAEKWTQEGRLTAECLGSHL